MAREMKDSGIPWIGEIPTSWTISRIKNEFLNLDNLREPISAEKRDNKLGLYDYYGASGVIDKIDQYNVDDTVLLIGEDGANLRMRNLPLIYRASGKFWVNNHAHILKVKPDNDYSYMAYLLEAGDYSVYITGSAQPKLSQFNLMNFQIAVPPVIEQAVIAQHLDAQCAEIDVVLEKTRASIEEYKKLKQAIITQAVTRGMRGDRPMKDSGIEWIPLVPDNWLVCKTLYCLSMPITDGPHTTPELYDEGIPFVSAEAVSCGNGLIDFSHIRGYISEEFYIECCKKYIPEIDDIYMIKSGATTGRVAIVDTDRVFTIWSPLAVFRCNPNVAVPKYIFYFLQSTPYQKQIELGWSYGTQQNIGMRTLERLKVCLPPLDEQKEIVEHLNNTISGVDSIIKQKEQILLELESYKKSLIYEYVTGKRETP